MGFDKTWTCGIVAERRADGQHVGLQHFGLDMHVLPESVEEFLVRDEPAGVVDQVLQHVVGARRQREPAARAVGRTLPDASIHTIQPKGWEIDHVGSPTEPQPGLVAAILYCACRSC